MILEHGHALYEGTVWHHRRTPKHRFHQRASMAWIDLTRLEELDGVSRLLSARHGAPARFRRSDVRGDVRRPLDEAARDFVEEHLGIRPAGSVYVLCNLRTWGWCFNPICVYFLTDEQGEAVAEILDVSNTPWHERHGYVLDRRSASAEFSFAKAFHVSPFLPMELTYDVLSPLPDQTFDLKLTLKNKDDVVFDAGFRGVRTELTPRAIRQLLLRTPTQRVSFSIYTHAVRLWAKRASFHSHPKKLNQTIFETAEGTKGNG